MTELIKKIKESIEIIAAPAIALGMVWGFDVSVYVAAGAGALATLLEYAMIIIQKKEEGSLEGRAAIIKSLTEQITKLTNKSYEEVKSDQ